LVVFCLFSFDVSAQWASCCWMQSSGRNIRGMHLARRRWAFCGTKITLYYIT